MKIAVTVNRKLPEMFPLHLEIDLPVRANTGDTLDFNIVGWKYKQLEFWPEISTGKYRVDCCGFVTAVTGPVPEIIQQISVSPEIVII